MKQKNGAGSDSDEGSQDYDEYIQNQMKEELQIRVQNFDKNSVIMWSVGQFQDRLEMLRDALASYEEKKQRQLQRAAQKQERKEQREKAKLQQQAEAQITNKARSGSSSRSASRSRSGSQKRSDHSMLEDLDKGDEFMNDLAQELEGDPSESEESSSAAEEEAKTSSKPRAARASRKSSGASSRSSSSRDSADEADQKRQQSHAALADLSNQMDGALDNLRDGAGANTEIVELKSPNQVDDALKQRIALAQDDQPDFQSQNQTAASSNALRQDQSTSLPQPLDALEKEQKEQVSQERVTREEIDEAVKVSPAKEMAPPNITDLSQISHVNDNNQSTMDGTFFQLEESKMSSSLANDSKSEDRRQQDLALQRMANSLTYNQDQFSFDPRHAQTSQSMGQVPQQHEVIPNAPAYYIRDFTPQKQLKDKSALGKRNEFVLALTGGYTPPDEQLRMYLLPIPAEVGQLRCTVERNKQGLNKLWPKYTLTLSDGDNPTMLESKRIKTSKTPHYRVDVKTGNEKLVGKGDGGYLGRLRANAASTEFYIFDGGLKADELKPGQPGALRQQYGTISYTAEPGQTSRKIGVYLPMVRPKTKKVARWPDNELKKGNIAFEYAQ